PSYSSLAVHTITSRPVCAKTQTRAAPVRRCGVTPDQALLRLTVLRESSHANVRTSDTLAAPARRLLRALVNADRRGLKPAPALSRLRLPLHLFAACAWPPTQPIDCVPLVGFGCLQQWPATRAPCDEDNYRCYIRF